MSINEIQIRLADNDDYTAVRDFYYLLIDGFQDAEFKPGWKKDIYPSQEFLHDSINRQQLYIGEADGQIISCMVVNHNYNDEYNDVKWSVIATDDELLVIHALGVLLTYSGKGIAKKMVKKVIDFARENNIKTIRLDVLLAR